MEQRAKENLAQVVQRDQQTQELLANQKRDLDVQITQMTDYMANMEDRMTTALQAQQSTQLQIQQQAADNAVVQKQQNENMQNQMTQLMAAILELKGANNGGADQNGARASS